ncbi:hypothetical protein Bbelb_368800 [Branchiostoma belcheri]|nr:hypothetical protein Bbelb_368800 [Branchiostoma belcheri]
MFVTVNAVWNKTTPGITSPFLTMSILYRLLNGKKVKKQSVFGQLPGKPYFFTDSAGRFGPPKNSPSTTPRPRQWSCLEALPSIISLFLMEIAWNAAGWANPRKGGTPMSGAACEHVLNTWFNASSLPLLSLTSGAFLPGCTTIREMIILGRSVPGNNAGDESSGSLAGRPVRSSGAQAIRPWLGKAAVLQEQNPASAFLGSRVRINHKVGGHGLPQFLIGLLASSSLSGLKIPPAFNATGSLRNITPTSRCRNKLIVFIFNR